MNEQNKALNLLASILINVEFFVTDQAEQLNYLQEQQAAGNKFVDAKILKQSDRLIEWIDKHENLQNQFAELLTYLKDNQEATFNFIEQRNKAILNYAHIEAINKDVLYWKDRADYYKNTRRLFYSAYIRIEKQLKTLQDGQKDKLN